MPELPEVETVVNDLNITTTGGIISDVLPAELNFIGPIDHITRQPGQLGVGHGLRHQHQCHGNPGDEIRAQGVRVSKFPNPVGKRHKHSLQARHQLTRVSDSFNLQR